MRQLAERRKLVLWQVVYLVASFLYTLYLYPIFNHFYLDSITAEYAIFHFGVVQLGLHHLLILLSFVLHVLLYYYPKTFLAYVIAGSWSIAACWLILQSYRVMITQAIPSIFYKLLIILPLLLGVIALVSLVINIYQLYIQRD